MRWISKAKESVYCITSIAEKFQSQKRNIFNLVIPCTFTSFQHNEILASFYRFTGFIGFTSLSHAGSRAWHGGAWSRHGRPRSADGRLTVPSLQLLSYQPLHLLSLHLLCGILGLQNQKALHKVTEHSFLRHPSGVMRLQIKGILYEESIFFWWKNGSSRWI